MPTARARYRRRPIMDQLARGEVDRWNPSEGGTAPDPPVEPTTGILTEAGDFLVTEGNDYLIQE